MKSVKVHIKNKKGLHARPSSLFVQLVTKYDSDISVKSEDETVNGKSIMGPMLLAAEEGRELELIADGPDELLGQNIWGFALEFWKLLMFVTLWLKKKGKSIF